jgi:hypothetical protein
VTSFGPQPAFVVADLNGDGSEDLVARVQASASLLGEVNGDLANWVVQGLDPRRERTGGTRVKAGERLLAVIHGHGPEGWQSPEARQAYLLQDAGGVEMKRGSGAGLHAGNAQTLTRGDVLVGRLDGAKAFLYWTGARYALGR